MGTPLILDNHEKANKLDKKSGLKAGDPVILIDRKKREFLYLLKEGDRINLSGDIFPHEEIIGKEEGFSLVSKRGNSYQVFRPTLAQSVLKMPRAATIIYPKDLGLILLWGDIYPGATVLEAGLGSGSLAMTLLRAVGPQGRVISYELRPDFKNCATKNVRSYYGEAPNHIAKLEDIYNGISEEEIDRVILDVPEPWRVIPHAEKSLRNGGIFVSYSPTAIQVKETVDALNRNRSFTCVQTMESILRPWEITEKTMRPDLQIVGHTGFLTFARKIKTQEVSS